MTNIIQELVEDALPIENAILRERVANLEADIEAYRTIARVALRAVADIHNDKLRDLRRENTELRALLMMDDIGRVA